MKNLENIVAEKVTEKAVEIISENNDLKITELAKTHLRGIRQWTKFFSVLYYIGTGILALQVLIILSKVGMKNGGFIFIAVCICLIGATATYEYK
jgi:hypothetical protein